jgi:hypothetical protein
MVVDDSDSDDNDDDDSSLGFKTHFEIEAAFQKARAYAKKKDYPKKALELINQATKEITRETPVHRQKIEKESPSITSYFQPPSTRKT